MAAPVSAAMGAVGLLLLLRLILSLKSLVYSLCKWWRWLDDRCQAHQVYKIPRYGEARQENPLFRKSLAYLHSLPSLGDSECTNIYSSGRKSNDFFMQLAADQSVVADSFLGSRLFWTLTNHPSPCLLLRLRRHDCCRVLRPYLYHIETIADDIDLRRKECRLFSVRPDGSWGCVGQLSHPATLETVAADAELKNWVRSDLESFLRGRSYYARLGSVWRRSYLLHGPPGTGKSTFAAAMAKFLNYDVYDLNLSRATATEADIKSLLLGAGPRSVILVEDLDRHLSASGSKADGVAAMMSFMDGVFSCCCDERVMVFTMSGGKEGIDPALLRPGRMDVHVYFPLCDFSAFKTLASSHLGLRVHKLYPQVEEGFQSGRARLSPAEVGEIMIANRGSPSRALKTVISALQQHSSSSARLFGSASANAGVQPEDSSYGPGGTGLGFGKEATVREFKKLFGLIRLRGAPGSKKEGTMSVQVAAAAAAAANVANYPDRSF